MTAQYRVRLIKRDGSKTRPVDVHLDPEMKAGELRRHLIGLINEHTIEDYPDRNAHHYALEVLKQRTDDVVHLYRTGG